MGRVKGRGDPPPFPSFPSFALAPTVRVTISTLPNLPLSENERWRLQQYYEREQLVHEQGFAHPKHACTAGYQLSSLQLCISRKSHDEHIILLLEFHLVLHLQFVISYSCH